MAKGLNMPVNLKFNTAQAQADLRQLQQSLNQITSAQKSNLGITSEIKEAINTAEILKRTLKEATSIGTGQLDLTKFNQTMAQSQMTIQKFKESLQLLGPEGEKAFNSLAVSIAKSAAPVQRTNAMFGELKNAFANSMRWSITSGAIRKVSAEIQKAFSYAQNLDKSLNSIRIVTGHNTEYMNKFADQANKAAKALSASTLEYTNAALIYYQQGLSDKEVQKRAETTIRLAKVSGESASQVSQQLTAVWNNFSNGVDNLERYADVMANLGAHTASSSSEIAKGLEKFASISKTIGLSYDYAATALATVTAQTRQSADSVGTSFKTLFSRLESLKLGDTLDDGVSLNKYSEALLKVGVNVLDVNGQLKNMDNILDELAGRWDQLNSAQQVALAQTVGGVRNYTQLIALMDNWETFQENLITAQTAEGTLKQQAEIYADSWEAAQQRVQTSMQTLYSTLISSDFFKGLNNLTSNFLDGISSVGKALKTSGSLSGAFMLGSRIYRDQFINGANNLENNLFANTQFGRNYILATQDAAMQSIVNAYGLQENPLMVGLETYRASGVKALQTAAIGRQQEEQNEGNVSRATTPMAPAQLQFFGSQVEKSLNEQADTRQAILAFKRQNEVATREAEIIKDKMADTNQILFAVEKGNQDVDQGMIDAATQAATTSILNLQTQLRDGTITAGQAQIELDAIKGAYHVFQEDMSGTSADRGIYEELLKNVNLTDKGVLSEEAIAQLQAGTHRAEDFERSDQYTNATTFGARLFNANLGSERIQRGLGPKINEKSEKTSYSFGQVAYDTSMMLNSVNMATNSLTNFVQKTREGTTTFGDVATTLGSVGMAAASTSKVFKNVTEVSGPLAQGLGKVTSMIPGVKQGGALVGATGGLTGAGFGLYAAAAAAIVGAGVLGYRIWNNNQLDTKAERANESKIYTSARAKEDKQKYDSFLEVAKQQNDTASKLYTLQEGTASYNSQLLTANEQARNMIETYNLQAGIDYAVGTNGLISFSQQQIEAINNRLEQQAIATSAEATISSSVSNYLNLAKQLESLDQEILTQGGIGDLRLAELSAAHARGEITDEIEYQNRRAEVLAQNNYQISPVEQEAARIRELQNIEYSMGLNAALSQNKNVDSLDQIAAMIATIQGVPEDYTAQLKEIDNSVRTTTGAYLSEETLREKYSTLFNGQVADANWGQQEIAEAILAREKTELFEGIISDIETQFAGHENELRAFYKENKDFSIQEIKAIETSNSYRELRQERQDFINTLKDQSGEINREILLQEAKARGISTHGTEEQIYEAVLKNADLNDFSVLSSINLINNSFKAQVGTNIDNLLETLVHFNISTDEQLKAFQQLKSSDLQLLNSYVGNYGANFGDKTAQFVYENLLSGKTINTSFLKELQSLGATNNIQALSAIEERRDLLRSQGDKQATLSNTLEDLSIAMREDIADRGGLAKTLFNSSDFQNVFISLTGAVRQGTKLTAENLVELSKKNETLSSYLSLNGVTSQGLVNLITSIGQGRLNVGQITDSLAQAYFTAGGAESAQQEGLSTLDEQDLGTSYSTLDKYYQNGGKAWYTAWANNMMNDAPLMNFLGSFLTTEDYQTYLAILDEAADASKDAKWIKEQVKSRMSNAYEALDTWQGQGRKKLGKGGGGFADMWVYLEQQGVLNGSGIEIDEDTGNIKFGQEFATSFPELMGKDTQITTQNLTEYLSKILQKSGQYDFFQAKTISKQMIGDMASSAMGNLLSAFDLEAGANQWFQDLLKEGIVNSDIAQAYFEAYRQGFANLFWDGTQFIKKGEGQTGTNSEGFITAITDLGIKISELDESDFTGKKSITLDELGQAIRGDGSVDTGWGSKNEVSNEQVVLDYLAASNIKQYKIKDREMVSPMAPVYNDSGKIAYDLKEILENLTASGMASDLARSTIEQLYTQKGQEFVFQKKDIFGNVSNVGIRDFNSFDEFYDAYTQNENDSEFSQAMQEHMYQKAMEAVDKVYAEASDEEIAAQGGWETLYRTEYERMKAEAATAKGTPPARFEEIKELEEQTSSTAAESKKEAVIEHDGQKITITRENAAEIEAKTHEIEDRSIQQPGTITEEEKFYLKYGKEILTAVKGIYENTDIITESAEAQVEEDQSSSSKKKSDGTTGKTDEEGTGEGDEEGVKFNEQQSTGGGTGDYGAGAMGVAGGGAYDNRTKQIQDLLNANGAHIQTDGIWGPETAGALKEASQEVKDAVTALLGSAASGQNNNITAFASGKKDGFIAVTGELGPELRVHSDGSMDLLGEKGREYTWVNQDDKIYTAAQTASILGNKSIEELQGLSKGINNFIPGFADAGSLVGKGTDRGSSGGGAAYAGSSSGGGAAEEEDHRYDPQWLQYRDTVERYYTILQQIENITNAVTRFSEIADRAWGKQRQDALKETIKLQEQQIDAQKKYLSEIRTYFKGDRDTLTTMMKEFVDEYNDALADTPGTLLSFEGAEFDENGVITNYREFAEALIDKFNQDGQLDQKSQYKLQERLKDIQQYTDTLNLLEEQEQQLQKLEEAVFDAKMNEIQVTLDYKLSLSQDQMTLIDYALGKVKDDAYEAARAVAEIGKQQEELMNQLGEYEIAFRDTLHLNFGSDSIGMDLIHEETTDLEQNLKTLEEFKEKFKKADTEDEYEEKATWETIKTDGTTSNVEHNIKEYYDTLLKYYTKYYNKYDELLPNPDDFFIWSDEREHDYDAEKMVLKNEEEVLEKLNYLRDRLQDKSIYVDYDEATQQIKNLDAVNESVQKLYDNLVNEYPEITAAIKEINENIIGEDGKINVQNYAYLNKIKEVINEISRGKLSQGQYDSFLSDAKQFFAEMSDLFKNPDFKNLPMAQVEAFRNQLSNILPTLTQLREKSNEIIGYVGDSLKTYFKDINAEIDNFDHVKDLYKDWINILDLTGQTITKIDHQLMSSLQDNLTNNYKKKLMGAHDAYKAAVNYYNTVNQEYLKAQKEFENTDKEAPEYDRLRQTANAWKEQLIQAEKSLEDAENTRMQSLIDLLERLKEEVNEVFKTAAAEFEDTFSPFFHTLDMLQTAFDREQQLQDLYLDAYDQAHDLSKLNRDIQQSIIDTDNLQGKKELKKLMQQINDVQKQGNKLTQYDVDNFQRLYDIELARQALEDARNAKSLVRLARDNNGNWSYVYTANEEDEEEAEQALEDKLNEAAKANEDRIKELSNNFIALQNEFEGNLNSLKDQDLTPEEIAAEAQKFYDAYLQKMQNTTDQLEAAMGNNQGLIDQYGKDYGDLLAGITTDFGGTILSAITGTDNLGDLADRSADSAGTLMERILKVYDDKYQEKKEAWALAELDVDNAAGETTKVIEDLGDRGTEALEKTYAAVDKSAKAFADLMEKINNADKVLQSFVDTFNEMFNADFSNIDELISHFENLATQITALIQASGEYTDTIGRVKIDGLVDDWDDLSKIYKSLRDNGESMLQYIDEDGVKQVVDLLAGDEDTNNLFDAWRHGVLGDWDAESWSGRGFDKEKSDIMSKLDKKDTKKIWDYYDELEKEIDYQLLDRLEVADKLYEKLKEKEIEFENEDEENKRATILFDKANNAEYVEEVLAAIKEIMEEALKVVAGGGGGSSFDWYQAVMATNWAYAQTHTGSFGSFTHLYGGPSSSTDTGGYTGRWQSADTGMYTGEWPMGSVRSNGRLAWLHQKELVLNAHDTENFLDAMEIVRQLDNLTNWMANGLTGILAPTITSTDDGTLEQNVHIEASFPNVTNRNEIEEAFGDLVNLASQYANRK